MKDKRNWPNIFLIGAMKSGTTTLHDLMAEHPEICMSKPKEPCYFVEPEVLKEHWPEMWAKRFWQDESTYLQLFQGKPGAKFFGESSTDYSKLPKIDGVVEKIAKYCAKPRFIYIMRDPIERTISHYWHLVRHHGEKRSPMEAIIQESHYMDVSHYARQLQPYIAQFGRENLLTLTFEELKDDAVSVVQTVFTWLGVDATFIPTGYQDAKNVTPTSVRSIRDKMNALHRFRYSNFWNTLGPLVPKNIRKIGVSMVVEETTRSEIDMSEVIAYLQPIQRAQTKELVALLGRNFPEWKTLDVSQE